MTKPSLDSFVAVPLPVELYAELAHRYPSSVSSVIEDLARDFLDRTADDFEAAPLSHNGIYWESLFLPSGTEVRTKYFNEYKEALIKGKDIVWEGNTYSSMSQLARTMRGNTSNNAWKVLEIKRPSDIRWRNADFLRR
jgi:hypothetical protein